MNDDKESKLCVVAEEVKKCKKCQLHKTRKNTVFGSGNAESMVLFVGEAPGLNEDEQGVPFCGAAGKFLDEMLQSIGFKREEIFITNTLKCRPPNNRDPEDDEKFACRPYLEKQIDIINPKLIITLGKHATASLMPGFGGMTRNHGKAMRRPNGRIYLSLYHPAAALHNGGLRKTLIEDFEKIPKILNKINKNDIQNKQQKEKIKQQKLV